MVPVVPMREDVRVGDVFFYATNPEGTVGDEQRTETTLTEQRWTSLIVSDDLLKEFKERAELPSTPDEYAEDPKWPDAEVDGVLFQQDGSANHLRTVHLPGFSVSRSQLDGSLPAYVNSLAFAASRDNWHAIGVRIPSAEAYSLDLEDLLGELLEDGRRGTQTQRIKQEHRVHLGHFGDPTRTTVYIRVVSEVLFARAVQITISYDNLISGDDDVEASELGLVDMEDDDEDEHDDDLDPTLAPVARAQAMNASMRKSGTDALPDGFVRFLTIGPDSVTVRKVWRRPLAIGVKGVTLEINKVTGDVVRMGWMGQPLRSR